MNKTGLYCNTIPEPKPRSHLTKRKSNPKMRNGNEAKPKVTIPGAKNQE